MSWHDWIDSMDHYRDALPRFVMEQLAKILLPKFEHKRLQHERSIRLVTLEPRRNYDYLVRCSVREIELHTSPVYEALSYTWFIDGDFGNPRKGRMRTILCNGKTFKVHQNLYNGLLQLREFNRGHLIWIDAICIDQDHDDEKSAQVNMMGKIFQDAKTVVVWLGRSSLVTKIALRLSRILFSPEQAQMKTYFTSIADRAKSPNKLEALRAALHVCLFFFSLLWTLGRGFFERVWTLQEVVLAKHVVYFLGDQQLSIQNLVENSPFMDTDNDKDISRMGEFMSGKFMVIQRAASFMHRTRREFHDNGKLCLMETAISEIRNRKTSKAADKVFAILSISAASDKMDPVKLRANYRKRVDKVYCECAEELLHGSTGLFLLSLVGQLRYGSANHISFPSVSTQHLLKHAELVSGLPSWVPDLTTPVRPYPLRNLIQNFEFKAATQHDPDFRILKGTEDDQKLRPPPKLQLKAAIVDVITEIGDCLDTTFYQKPWRFLEVPTHLGTKYRHTDEDVVDVFAKTLVAGQSVTANYLYNTVKIDESHFAEWFATVFAEDTMFYGPYVGKYILQEEDLELSPEEQLVDPHERKSWYPVVESRARGKLKINAVRHFISRFDDDAKYGFRKKIEDRYQQQLQQRGYQVRSALRFTIRDDSFHAPPYKNMFEKFYLHRCLFITQNGYMGTGPWTVEKGDRVMLVAGAYVPYILRPSTKEPECWELVGEAYCHGIMFGGALNPEFQTITIV